MGIGGTNGALAHDGGTVLRDGHLTVVADARLDNRADLAAQLGTHRSASVQTVIAAAYRKWGCDCPPRLDGEFALAVLDTANRRLLCARDPMGVKPLYYALDRASLRFAQSQTALAPRQGGPAPLRDEAIADFLYGRVLDANTTWFAGVHRLPPGHSMVFQDGTLRLHQFYQLRPAADGPAADPGETLRHLLDQAVARRADAGPARVGALLSGGLDSSSIACLLRDQRQRAGQGPLPVFSMMFREPERSNERPHLDAVLAGGGFDPVVLELDGYAPLDGFATLLDAMGGPTLSPNLACMRQVLGAAADHGIGVLLDGHGGDEVVSHGYGLLDELAGRGAWLALLREARGAADNYGRSHIVLTRRVAARQQRADARLIARLLAPFDRPTQSDAAPSHLLSADLLARSTLRGRLRAFARPEAAGGEQAQHHAVLVDPLQSYAFEVHAAFYRSMGIEPRYPFWARQVVEFCLGLPAQEKLSRGWSRLVLRRAMAGVVPASVLRRRDKIDFTVHLARGLVRHHREQIEELLQGRGSVLAPFIDSDRAAGVFARIVADPDQAAGRDVQMVWRATALGMWLENGCGTHRENNTSCEVAA